MLPMDPTLIEQVLINLMENAFVHSESTEPVELTICEQEDNVLFRVRDFGKGISEQQMPGLFEGQQPGSTTTDGYKGIGIGLTICKTIILAHGGTITASNHEKGADFIFTLHHIFFFNIGRIYVNFTVRSVFRYKRVRYVIISFNVFPEEFAILNSSYVFFI